MTARSPLALLVVAGALSATGCGAAAGSNVSSRTFAQPEQQAVKTAVEDFADLAGKRDYSQICSDALAAPLVKQLDDAKGTDQCPDQLKLSLRDVDQTKLAVLQVRVAGTNAEATVQPTGTGDVEPQARMTLVKEGSRWKLAGIL